MRTAARERALQIAPRNCSTKARGEVSIYAILTGQWVHTVMSTFRRKVSASHEEQMLLLMILELF